jgi:hypothetical protein
MPDLEKITKAKRHIDRISREKVQADERIKYLKGDRERLYKELKEAGISISSIAEGEALQAKLGKGIEEETDRLVEILREIGVNV